MNTQNLLNLIKILKNILKLSEEEELKIRNFERGNCLFYAGKNHVEARIQAYDYEYDLITTDRADLERMEIEKREG